MSVAAKICGLSTEEAVTTAVAGGAAYLGFVFYPHSPRAVTPQQATRLCRAVPAGIARIDILQFHGNESPDRVAKTKRRFGRRVMKAVSIAGPQDVLGAALYEEVADLLLF